MTDPSVPFDQAADVDYKKRCSLSSVQTKFKVTSIRQLTEWKRQLAEGGSRIDKLKAIRLETGKQFLIAKQHYGISKRNITKFVTEKYLKEEPERKKSADECVALVRSRIQAYRMDYLWNADQSAFEYEIRPGRTLDFVGTTHVLVLTPSENSMIHSYTVMMCVSPGTRKFLPVLFLTL
ncbi:hypothetical protein RvY_02607 [Ramazzottius varieornatus]|uniref:Uncharacterized protein n=1 Tax=Ramazzottius varieornatus TaxID=947166 RepID=A0A1D1UUU7_RAMVA|nr:hypothetical protein RvY_02607 [Ramazzottius varieornatus]